LSKSKQPSRLSFSNSEGIEKLLACVEADTVDVFVRELYNKNAVLAERFERWLGAVRCKLCQRAFDKTGAIYLHAGGKWWECGAHLEVKDVKQ